MTDMVNKPPHYNRGGSETIDEIKSLLDDHQFEGYLLGNILKYISRYQYKNEPVVDLKKSSWYLNKLIEIRSEQ